MKKPSYVNVVKKTVGSEVFYNVFVADVCKDSEKSLIEKFVNTENIFFDYNRIQVCRMLATVLAIVNGIPECVMEVYIDTYSDIINYNFSDEVLQVWTSEYREIVNSYF